MLQNHGRRIPIGARRRSVRAQTSGGSDNSKTWSLSGQPTLDEGSDGGILSRFDQLEATNLVAMAYYVHLVPQCPGFSPRKVHI